MPTVRKLALVIGTRLEATKLRQLTSTANMCGNPWSDCLLIVPDTVDLTRIGVFAAVSITVWQCSGTQPYGK